MQLGIGIDRADAALDLGKLVRRDEIRLVEDDDVGEGDLALRLRRILQPIRQPLGIGHRHHRIEARGFHDILVDEEGLRDRGRIGETGGFHDDRVELAAAAHQALDDADEVAPHRAADAAVVHLEHFLVRADDELVVDADLAELVDDHRELLAVRLGEDAVEERRLAGAEIACQHRHRDLGALIGAGLAHRVLSGTALSTVEAPSPI